MGVVWVLAALCCAAVTGADVDQLEETVRLLTSAMINLQLQLAEKSRTDGDSGVKQIRHTREGSRTYYGESHSGKSYLHIHDHANTVRTLGMGELSVVLNGVEFRSRHNDPSLAKPHETSKDYERTTNIEFPPVPPEVLAAGDVSAQIDEMRKFFEAWKKLDSTLRDYKPYFKAVLCYLEGAWTTVEPFSEPFFSSRHVIGASSWRGLRNRVLFQTYGGSKNHFENFALLPTELVDYENGTLVETQWNYRVMCHPLKRDLPYQKLKLVNDLTMRMIDGRGFQRRRSARFQLQPVRRAYRKLRKQNYGLLDELMGQIPGKDNYVASLTDSNFGRKAFEFKKNDDGTLNDLNAGFYHRWFRTDKPDAMGNAERHRGFSDANIFMAMTSQWRVPGRILQPDCGSDGDCGDVQLQRWSYAIPLEIVYTTPLMSWNPYNITFRGYKTSSEAQAVTADGRWGSTTDASKALNGSHSDYFYWTPYEFFEGGELTTDPADSVRTKVGILDGDGELRVTRATGFRVFLPKIPGVGSMRTRYPVAPVHGEGSGVWKELNALKDIVLDPFRNRKMFNQKWNKLLKKLNKS